MLLDENLDYTFSENLNILEKKKEKKHLICVVDHMEFFWFCFFLVYHKE